MSAEEKKKKSPDGQKFAGKDIESFAIAEKKIKADAEAKKGGFFEAVASIRPADFTEVHLKPCVRDGYLTGMGSGFAVGFLRAIIGASVWTSCNWAVGSFCVGSFVAYEICQKKRKISRGNMQRAMEVMDKKREIGRARAAEKKGNAEPGRAP